MPISRKVLAFVAFMAAARIGTAQGRVDLARGRAEALSRALVGMGAGEGASCATTLLVEGHRVGELLSPDARGLVLRGAARPILEGAAFPAGERVWVHGPTDRSDELLSAVSRAIRYVRATFQDPQFPRRPVDVVLGTPTLGASSLFWDEDGRPAGILVAGSVQGEALTTAVLHQMLHLWQLERPMPPVPPSWLEGTAVWLSESGANLAARVTPSQNAREAAIDDVALLSSRATLPAFLVEGSPRGADLLVSLYAMLHDGRGFPESLEAVLAGADRGTAAGFALEHAVWLAMSGPRDNGKYFSFGKLLPPGRDRVVPDDGRMQIPVGAGGATVAVVKPVAAEGGTWVTVSAPRSPDARSLRAAAIVRSVRGGLRIAAIPATSEGTLSVGVPSRDVAEILVVAVNVGPLPALVAVESRHDPVFPFVLSSFTVDPTDAGVMVRFTVSEEESLRGWRILRSTDPARGFTSLSPILIPGRGDARDPLTYVYLDDTARAGTRYYYYLEAMSLAGFSEPSFMVSVTTPPAPPVPR
ncbi:MAG: hypothetical protein U0166_19310 [Acidobacteriota bacterium]